MAKILVVDDDIMLHEITSEILGNAGHEVEVAHNGRLAVERLEKGERFDLIMTDLIMPEMDGIGFLKYLQESENSTPVLVLSGGGVTISSSQALSSVEGVVSGVVEKPFQYDDLLKKIETVLQGQDI